LRLTIEPVSQHENSNENLKVGQAAVWLDAINIWNHSLCQAEISRGYFKTGFSKQFSPCFCVGCTVTKKFLEKESKNQPT
jgi:hypothetical protein